MNATDMWFDGYFASDFGLMLGSIDGNNEVASGGDLEYSVAKVPNDDKYRYYTGQFTEVLVWNVTLIKDTCSNDNITFSYEEERRISKWLVSKGGYKWLQFIQEGYEDLFYCVKINVKPNQLDGNTVGFDLTITSNCGYGFSSIITQEIQISSGLGNSKSIYVDNDISDSYVKPKVTITGGSGDFYIFNNNDLEQRLPPSISDFKNITSGTTVIMDSDNEIITGVASDNFSYYFIRLLDGENMIITNSTNTLTLKFEYREARKVIV